MERGKTFLPRCPIPRRSSHFLKTQLSTPRCGASCRAEQNSASNSCKTPLVLSMAPREMLTRAKRSRWEERLHEGSTLPRGVGGGVNGARSEHRAGTARVLGWDERRWPRCEISDAAPRPHRTRMHQPRVARVSHCCAGGLPGHCVAARRQSSLHCNILPRNHLSTGWRVRTGTP